MALPAPSWRRCINLFCRMVLSASLTISSHASQVLIPSTIIHPRTIVQFDLRRLPMALVIRLPVNYKKFAHSKKSPPKGVSRRDPSSFRTGAARANVARVSFRAWRCNLLSRVITMIKCGQVAGILHTSSTPSYY